MDLKIVNKLLKINLQDWSADPSVRNDFEQTTVATGYYGKSFLRTFHMMLVRSHHPYSLRVVCGFFNASLCQVLREEVMEKR